jgi:hypothetical protein
MSQTNPVTSDYKKYELYSVLVRMKHEMDYHLDEMIKEHGWLGKEDVQSCYDRMCKHYDTLNEK